MTAEFDVSLSLSLERAARSARRSGVLDDYAAGVPISEIAKKYSMSDAYVVKLARSAGLTRYTSRPGRRAQAVEAYVAGTPVADIVRDLGVDRKSVYAWARQAGVALRRPELGRRPEAGIGTAELCLPI
jgi:uncharacterized protein (DUF433 family)